MKKTEMLKKNYEFKNVLTKGKFYIGKEIEIFILKNNKKRNFLGIAIGTKNGKAFQRNKAKRLIRESYTKLENTLEDGYNIVILMNKKFPINDMQFVEVLEDMKNIFLKAEILKKEEEIWKKYVYI
mgnify:FL=1